LIVEAGSGFDYLRQAFKSHTIPQPFLRRFGVRLLFGVI
jgi:hypothetical protein